MMSTAHALQLQVFFIVLLYLTSAQALDSKEQEKRILQVVGSPTSSHGRLSKRTWSLLAFGKPVLKLKKARSVNSQYPKFKLGTEFLGKRSYQFKNQMIDGIEEPKLNSYLHHYLTDKKSSSKRSIFQPKVMENYLEKKLGNEFIGKRDYDVDGFGPSYEELGKRIGNEFIGKRIGNEFLGKRMGNEFLGKRMGSEFVGKRMGSEFVGKRLGSEFVGKRMGNEFLGKRMDDDDLSRYLLDKQTKLGDEDLSNESWLIDGEEMADQKKNSDYKKFV